jgi:hypothetical protein
MIRAVIVPPTEVQQVITIFADSLHQIEAAPYGRSCSSFYGRICVASNAGAGLKISVKIELAWKLPYL